MHLCFSENSILACGRSLCKVNHVILVLLLSYVSILMFGTFIIYLLKFFNKIMSQFTLILYH